LDSLYNTAHPPVCWWWNDHLDQWFWPNRGSGAYFDPKLNRYTSGLVPNVLDARGFSTIDGNAHMDDTMANIVFYDSLLFFERPLGSGYYVFPADGWSDPAQFLVCTTAKPSLLWGNHKYNPDPLLDTAQKKQYIHCLPDSANTIAFTNPSSGIRSNFLPLSNKGFKGDCPNVDTSDTCWRRTNFAYTLEFHKQFVYKPGQKFTFEGDDDTWIFINDSLVVDLGGMHSPISGTADLDALGKKLHMVIGNTYWLDFFYCERMSPGSDIRITTNMFSYAAVPMQRYWQRDYGNLE
jgi:fibro-slime domain-containing protein